MTRRPAVLPPPGRDVRVTTRHGNAVTGRVQAVDRTAVTVAGQRIRPAAILGWTPAVPHDRPLPAPAVDVYAPSIPATPAERAAHIAAVLTAVQVAA